LQLILVLPYSTKDEMVKESSHTLVYLHKDIYIYDSSSQMKLRKSLTFNIKQIFFLVLSKLYTKLYKLFFKFLSNANLKRSHSLISRRFFSKVWQHHIIYRPRCPYILNILVYRKKKPLKNLLITHVGLFDAPKVSLRTTAS